jgi:putative addiction module component (TIGR02574 family)
MDNEPKLLYEDEWRLELKRRAAELDSGAVKAIPWSEVKEHLLSLLREDE